MCLSFLFFFPHFVLFCSSCIFCSFLLMPFLLFFLMLFLLFSSCCVPCSSLPTAFPFFSYRFFCFSLPIVFFLLIRLSFLAPLFQFILLEFYLLFWSSLLTAFPALLVIQTFTQVGLFCVRFLKGTTLHAKRRQTYNKIIYLFPDSCMLQHVPAAWPPFWRYRCAFLSGGPVPPKV